jgi:glycosyltransferase involved in cell wall biosynthesis
MRILFLYSSHPRYVRNLVLSRALRLSHDVVEVASPSASRLKGNLSIALRYLFMDRRTFDLVVIGFPGHLLVPWVRLWRRLPKQTPVLFDPFVSWYDTFCLDRRWFRPNSVPGRLAYALDFWSCRWADRLLADTCSHRDFFIDTFNLSPAKIAVAYVGCDEAVFVPRPEPPPAGPRARVIHLFTYTSFLRLHGVETILYAAKELEERRDIILTVAGAGSRLSDMQKLAGKLGLGAVRFPGWVPFDQLPDRIAEADICLGGHFSRVPKAARVISTKTFQFIAMRKPTIVGDNPATREVFVPGEHVWAVPMGNPAALASAIRTLADDQALRQRIAAGGYNVFQRQFTTQAIAQQLAPVLEEAACASAS